MEWDDDDDDGDDDDDDDDDDDETMRWDDEMKWWDEMMRWDEMTWMLTRKSAWDLRVDHTSAMGVAWHLDCTMK